jgi:hypothetical protein
MRTSIPNIKPLHPAKVTYEVTSARPHPLWPSAVATHEGQEFTSSETAPLGWCWGVRVQGCKGAIYVPNR